MNRFIGAAAAPGLTWSAMAYIIPLRGRSLWLVALIVAIGLGALAGLL